MPDATFTRPDLTTFTRLDGLGLEVTGQLLEPDRAVLACRVVAPDDWCRRCGCQGVPRDTVTRELAHEPFGWRPTTLLVTVRRYRCTECAHVWRQDTTAAAEPRAKISRAGLRWGLVGIVVGHLSMARVAEGLGVSWNTANDAVLAEGRRLLIADPARLDGVRVVGVDEHAWRHTRKGDKYVTVVIDLTPVRDGTGPSRLLAMLDGRSKSLCPGVAGPGVGGRGLRWDRQARCRPAGRRRRGGRRRAGQDVRAGADLRDRAGRKTDATDAHSIALVGVRMSGLRPVISDEQLEVLRMCVDRRRSLGEEHVRKVCQLHKLLLELIPGGAKTFLSAAQAKELLRKVRPTTPAGKVRKAHARELVEDLAKIYARTKDADKELKDLVTETGSSLMDLHGIGPSGAARLLVEVGDITRFPDRNHFASWTGTAPVDASSGEHVRHRLSRGGNRQINRVLHVMAIVQLRTRTTQGRVYYDQKKEAGKTSMEALRCLKRRLSDRVYKQMLDDLARRTTTGPGGHLGDDSDSSATGSQPTAGSSDKPLPGPATSHPRTTLPAAS